MKKYFYPFIFTVFFLLIFRLLFPSAESRINNYFAAYGIYLSDKPTEVTDYTFPEKADDVFNNYNNMQKTNGFDLEPYLGKTVTRYTYEVKNYGDFGGEPLYANILIFGKKIIASDITNVSLGGYMVTPNELYHG